MLLLGFGLCATTALALAQRWAPTDTPRDRWLAAAVLLPTVGITSLRVLGGLGWLQGFQVLLWLAALAVLAVVGWRPKAVAWRPPLGIGAGFLPLGLSAAALGVALVAARVLPVWQWDALGYHLPFVAHALQAGSLAGVPWDAPYLGTYPHGVELWDLGARALLSDDRWLDAAELPLCVTGAVATAGLSRRAGATPPVAVGFGALWLTLPAVFLQLPSAYLDVVAASFLLLALYWLLAPPSLAATVLCALSLGLYLDSKPTALLPTAVLGAVLGLRCWRAGQQRTIFLAAGVVLVLGSETYLMNTLHHGNPLWPIRLSLGRWTLSGKHTLTDVLSSGAKAPHLSGPLPWRIWKAWIAFNPLPTFDMRTGGFGPLFTYLALPVAALGVLRRRGLWLLLLGIPLLTADPAIARYTLAFPAVCLALAAAELSRFSPLGAGRSALPGARFWQPSGLALATGLAALGLWLALPGLTDNQHTLRELWARNRQAREALLLPSTSAPAWAAFRAGLPREATVATDDSFDLRYLLWRPDLGNRVELLPPDVQGDALLSWLDGRGVRFVVASREASVGTLAAAHPERLRPLFPCGASDPTCAVWWLRPKDL